MAKGSVRKKGKKWYYRFYVEDESGNRVQKEFPGTESKSESTKQGIFEIVLRRSARIVPLCSVSQTADIL